MKSKLILLFFGICSIIFLVLSFLQISAALKFTRSIGIIGGADGPTSILLANRSPVPYHIIAGVLVCITLLLFIRYLRKR